jgi:hypothetical protein
MRRDRGLGDDRVLMRAERILKSNQVRDHAARVGTARLGQHLEQVAGATRADAKLVQALGRRGAPRGDQLATSLAQR